MKPTYGKGQLGRIYERLRKRSYRNIFRLDKYHQYYVMGVKDALEAVHDEGLVGQ